MSERTWTPGTWWRAPAEERRWAYYLALRRCYGMTAREALEAVRLNWAQVDEIIDEVRSVMGGVPLP